MANTTTDLYKQCRLTKTLGEGRSVETVSWIPDKYAVQDKAIKLKNSDGSWDDGWIVSGVGTTAVERTTLDNQRHAQREFADKLADH